MHLGDLARDLTLDPVTADITITGLSADSRRIEPGFLFAALAGAKVDGARFVAAAIEAGAVAVLAAEDAGLPDDLAVPVLRTEDPRRQLALMAARFYAAQPGATVAVTGTAGKTSVATFTRQIWQQAGYDAASLGTLGVTTAEGTQYGSLTTPDTVGLHETLAELAGEGITHLAMEASSHGIDQRRLDGVRLKAAAFTNLGRDHLDYHADLEDYFAAKLRLFTTLLPDDGTVVVDADEPYADRVAAVAGERGLPLFTIGRAGMGLRLTDLAEESAGQRLTIEAGGETYTVLLPLIGRFQVSNALISAGLAIVTGTPVAVSLAALEHLQGAPGRLDLVGRTENGAPCFVDYAHKPDALANVLAALRPHVAGRLVVVFGAGGDRDPGKRAIMGEIAARDADVVIVTDDNPRSEDPARIRAAIMAAAPGAKEIGDRHQAIAEAVAMLQAGDVLVVAGKGHETGQIVGDQVLPFSDHEEVRAALARSASGGGR
ncbi:MAG: UDP-N-acetylmuramoyl-L-alanyl-D-glutamate--2,6-diaminopimelate ligase [Hyphomicrobiales bacterium]|nr:MAG: UDP-N-acetylmuramoyl-L-alanyl-D-glutamate--2,6-diaminopimelate ligase [Hyphomicrobiales bacterium]